jgi:membrane-associated protein
MDGVRTAGAPEIASDHAAKDSGHSFMLDGTPSGSQHLDFISLFTHLDAHIKTWAQDLGPWVYVILFVVVFAETGLVVTPFLPGDSLLFTVGVVAARFGTIELWKVIPLLTFAAILGDTVNYAVGKKLGPAVFTSERSLLFNRKHLVRTQDFYERYGGKAIIIARFIPIIRTFAPFVAGIGKMNYGRFISFNVVGALVWVPVLTLVGYKFAHQEFVQKRFHVVIFGIILISILPALIEIGREYLRAKKKTPAA